MNRIQENDWDQITQWHGLMTETLFERWEQLNDACNDLEWFEFGDEWNFTINEDAMPYFELGKNFITIVLNQAGVPVYELYVHYEEKEYEDWHGYHCYDIWSLIAMLNIYRRAWAI